MVEARRFLKADYILKGKKCIKSPEISVILPTFRRADSGLLQRAIDSVLGQTFKNFELIVVDDGSVDSTQEVLKEYVNKDNRVIYVRNEVNCGLPALRVNQGIMMARGKYIAYQFDDDQWINTALENLRNEIVKHDTLCMVYGSYNAINVIMGNEYLRDKEFSFYDLVKGNYIANNSILHSRELFDVCGMYDPHLFLRRVCDWDLWLRFSKKAEIFHIPEVVSIVETRHNDSLAEIFPYDMGLYRKYVEIDRDEQLTPEQFPSYILNDMKIEGTDTEEIYKLHFLKWDSLHDVVNRLKVDRKGYIYFVKNELDASAEIMVGNFRHLLDGYQIVYLPVGELKNTNFQEEDILILCRVLSYGETQIITSIREKNCGITIIYALDDNLFVSHKRSKEFEYLAPGTPCYNALEFFVKNADCCLVPNERLGKLIKEYSEGIKVIPTNIRRNYLCSKNSYVQSDKFRIFFAGGECRSKEFDRIVDDLIKIAKKYKNKVEFIFVGWIPEKMQDVTEAKVSFVPFMQSYYQYLNYMSNCKFNLLVCPLDENEFNITKSPIKLLECCCCGAVGLFSDTVVYDCVVEGKNGFKISKDESWFEKIENIMKSSPRELGEIFNSALELVEKKYVTETMTDLYNNILLFAKMRRRLKQKDVLVVAGDIKEERKDELYKVVVFLTELGINVYLATSKETYQKTCMQLKNTEQLKYVKYYAQPDDVENNNKEKYIGSRELSEVVNKIGLIYSLEFFIDIGKLSNENMIPYVADVTRKCNEVINENEKGEYRPIAVFASDIDVGLSWEFGKKISYIYTGMKWNKPTEFYQSLFEVFSVYFENQKQMIATKNALVTKKQIANQGLSRLQIESEMLSLSRPLGKKREYAVFCDWAAICGIALIFESKSNKAMECDVKLELVYKNVVLRTRTKTIRNNDYNQWVNFDFPLLSGAGGNEFILRLTLTNNKASSAKLSVFEDRRNRGFVYKVLNKLRMKPKGKNVPYLSYMMDRSVK